MENVEFLLVTARSSIMKTITTALKELLTDANIVFTPAGIFLTSLSKTQSSVVDLKLFGNKFEKYHCARERIVINTSLEQLAKVVNSVKNNETFSMYIDKSHYDHGHVSHLTFRFDDVNLNRCKILELKLMNPDVSDLQLPDVAFSSMVSLESTYFQSIIRDAKDAMPDKLQIKFVGNLFSVTGQGASIGYKAECMQSPVTASSSSLLLSSSITTQHNDSAEDDNNNENTFIAMQTDDVPESTASSLINGNNNTKQKATKRTAAAASASTMKADELSTTPIALPPITITTTNPSDAVIYGEYPFDKLLSVTKCTPLSTHVQLYLQMGLPLIVKYEIISGLGELKMCLTSVADE